FSCAQTVEIMRKYFGDECMLQTRRIHEWYEMFKKSRECVEGDPCALKVHLNRRTYREREKLVLTDRRLTIGEMNVLGISLDSCLSIWKEN
ncbi:hypothetical protein EAI_08126, partial [Harpegnathos saltator]